MRVLYSDRGFAFLFFELRRCMRMIVFLSEFFYLFFSRNLFLLPKFVSGNLRGSRRERGQTRSDFVALILNKGVW